MVLRSGSVVLAFCALLLGTASAWALAPHDKTVGVQAERHAQNGIQAQQNTSGEPQKAAEAPFVVPSVHTPSGNGESQTKAQQSAEDGTEFWPPLYGYRFKVTDSIIAVFTALLFIATLALWWSTRALVRSADQNAERQIRAYIGIDRAFMTVIDPTQGQVQGAAIIKNSGQTPAYNLKAVLLFGVWDTSVEIEDYSDFIAETKKVEVMVMPQGAVENRMMPSAESQRAAIEHHTKGTLGFFIIGRITYRDAFGKDRFTNVRMGALKGQSLFMFDEVGNEVG